ncbi:DNA-directed RNA polymerase subunit beta [Nocardia sputorum]|uniref:DNA-directed RNA polymerase subunit beta n=1 Tax=Nocardia sputorum TaxID=2984338 RepID=A0ABN6UDW5_9NOCA|nr:DNA-directed RNA polymerase subunit beta [Nocardia sputorum]BDT93181.1 hypothetical protein IFM12275_31570 [Nocardia sputorum]BDU03497.1 hypothetical protein IFM12276_65250 [Nocardia sputorum]
MDTHGDTPLSRCLFYRRECALPAVVDPPELGRIVMRAGSVWAMTMPTRLGQAVKAHLQSGGVALGPIVGHPRSGRWTFLTQPDLPDDVRLFAELFRLDVAVARSGATIALPSPTAAVGAIRHWVVPPRNAFRPSGHLVVEAVRAWADQMPRTRRRPGKSHVG